MFIYEHLYTGALTLMYLIIYLKNPLALATNQIFDSFKNCSSVADKSFKDLGV